MTYDIMHGISQFFGYISSIEGIADMGMGLAIAAPVVVFSAKFEKDAEKELAIFKESLERNGLKREDKVFGDLESTIFPQRYFSMQMFLDCGDLDCMENDLYVIGDGFRKGFEGIWQRMHEDRITRPEAFNHSLSLEYLTNTVDMYVPR